MSRTYELIILTFLLLDALALVVLWRTRRPRKKSWRFVLAGMLVVAWLVIFYGSFIEPRLLIINRTEISLRGGTGATVSIALLSDFHVGPYKDAGWVSKVVEKVQSLSPDVILLAGDFILEESDSMDELAPLKNFRAPLGVFAVLGNHDYDDYLTLVNTKEGQARAERLSKKLESLGVEVLINEGEILEKDGSHFVLLGTDDIWTGYANVSKALTHVDAIKNKLAQIPNILLSHNPDIVQQAQKQQTIDLVLAGHTHGGQIRLPFLGSVPQIPTELGNTYDRGLFTIGDTQLFITSGLGETGPRARLFVPPEIALLEIKL